MQPGQTRRINEIKRGLMCGTIFRGEAGNQVSTKRTVGTHITHRRNQCQHISGEMTPFHPLQDQVITMLHRKMQMRHQPVIFGKGSHQISIDF